MEACLQVDARWSVKRHSEQHEQALLEPCLSHQKKPWLILVYLTAYLDFGWVGANGDESVSAIDDLAHGQVMHASQGGGPVHLEGTQLCCHGPRACPGMVELTVELGCGT